MRAGAFLALRSCGASAGAGKNLSCLRSSSRAVAFLVFFAGAAGTRIVAPDFRASPNRLGRLSLGRASLILQIFLLTLLPALDLARDFRQVLRLTGARGSTSRGCVCARGTQLTRRLRPRLSLLRLFPLLNLNVKQIADRLVVDARHHVFK